MKKLFFLCIVFLSADCCKASNPTDHFRSALTGDWATLSTWESSPDSTTWSAATLIPNSASASITIRLSHVVTVSSNQDMDQMLIDISGTLQHNAGTLTVNDGPGNDIILLLGAVFHLNINPGPVFSGSATVLLGGGSILRLSATGLTGAGTGVNASNYIYSNNTVLEYTLSVAFSTDGVTYFPNAPAGIIPVFKTTSNIGAVGSNSTTTFNGLFEANGNITFENSGEKVFRNGISGTGNIDGSTSGKFIINGTGGYLSGTGNLIVPAIAGMEIGNGTFGGVVTAANKTITNNIAQLNNTYMYLIGASNLTMNGVITGYSNIAYVVTTGTGKLIINNIAATPVTFPVGRTPNIYNPVTISNGGGFNYGVRVDTGISPAIVVPLKAVNRTWYVTPIGGTPGTVNTSFSYAAGHGNSGFNYTANLELGHHTGVWNVIQTGIVPSGSYQATTTVSTFANNTEAPLVLGNLYAILAVDDPVSVNYFSGIKQNGNHLLNWKVTCVSTPSATIEMERSTDGRNYSSIYSIFATALRCQQPFNHTDNQPAKGINYYRLKMTDADGKITYSTIVTLINAVKGIDVMNIAPNPIVNGTFILKVSTAEKIQMELVITDMQGRVLQKQSAGMIAGFNQVPMNVRNLAAGTYQLYGNTADGRTRVLRFVVQ